MILRTIECDDCGLLAEIELESDQWDSPPPDCPGCAQRMTQVFQPFQIGSLQSKAARIAEDIAREDYGVTDLRTAKQIGDVAAKPGAASWASVQQFAGLASNPGAQAKVSDNLKGANFEAVRELKRGIAAGTMPDIIANSRRQSIKVW